jgi:mannose/fructose/N-acetylgalactosamine-specific phosphotransferase system component IID
MKPALILVLALSSCHPAYASSGKLATASVISTLVWNGVNIETTARQTVKVYKRGRKIAAAMGRGLKQVARTAVGK